MQTPLLQSPNAQLTKAYERLCLRAKNAPKEAYVAGGLCLLVVLLVGLHTVFSAKKAILRVHVQHNFRTARLEVSVDGETAYSGRLTGNMHKRFGLVPEGIQGNWSQSIPVTAGQHRISVRVVGDDGSDHVENTAAKFVNDGERELAVVARHADLTATWAGNSNSSSPSLATIPPDTPPNWFNRYASTLFLTIAGSIVSALSGYAIREIPGWLRSRSADSETHASQPAAAGR
jgi:hypothetical protein